jgi:hypothetical protein
MAAQTEVSMQTPSMPLTWQVGGGAPELVLVLVLDDDELLELLDDDEPPTVIAVSALMSPLNLSRSTLLAPPIPGTVPASSYCQNEKPVKGAGTSGQVTCQLAIQSWAWLSSPAGLPSVSRMKLGDE